MIPIKSYTIAAIFLLSSLFIQMIGCTSPAEQGVLSKNTTSPKPSTISNEAILQKTIPANTESLENTAIVETSPTSTNSLATTIEESATPVPTVTSLPTLFPERAKDTILELIANNGGCDLPCWWGIVPGKTSLGEAQHILEPLRGTFEEFRFIPQGGRISLEIPSHDLGMIHYYLADENIVDMILVSAQTTASENEHKIYGSPAFVKDWENYLLPNVLDQFGQPTEVWLAKSPAVLDKQDGGYVPFYLLVFFQKKGIMVQYKGLVELHEGQIAICPNKADVDLWLWKPEEGITLDYVIQRSNRFAIGDFSYYKPIEEVTEMDVEEFSETFKNADTSKCFESPRRLWP
jgi:hypothetical protein